MNDDEFSSESDIDGEDILMSIEEEAQNIIMDNLIPRKSAKRYNSSYEEFLKWRENKNTDSLSEELLLVYFNELSKNLKPNSLWSRFSMLKNTIASVNSKINLDDYHRLKCFLKNKSKGYNPKKAKVFTLQQVNQFLNEASDEIYLSMKVALIFGICGAMRTCEFCSLTIEDIENTDNKFIVTVKDTKNYYPRNFIIGNEFYEKVQKYQKLRPAEMETKKFFINYQNGKCTRQVMGKNKISGIPKTIALYLNLKDAERFTGHCFRRTSATLLADAGANLISIKQLGGWRSSAVAEGYIENSIGNKQKIFNQIISSDQPSTSAQSETIVNDEVNIDQYIGENSNHIDEDSNYIDQNSYMEFVVSSELSLSPIKCTPKRQISVLQENNLDDEILSKKRKMSEKTKKNKNAKENIVGKDIFEQFTADPKIIKVKKCKINKIVVNNYNYK